MVTPALAPAPQEPAARWHHGVLNVGVVGCPRFAVFSFSRPRVFACSRREVFAWFFLCRTRVYGWFFLCWTRVFAVVLVFLCRTRVLHGRFAAVAVVRTVVGWASFQSVVPVCLFQRVSSQSVVAICIFQRVCVECICRSELTGDVCTRMGFCRVSFGGFRDGFTKVCAGAVLIYFDSTISAHQSEETTHSKAKIFPGHGICNGNIIK